MDVLRCSALLSGFSQKPSLAMESWARSLSEYLVPAEGWKMSIDSRCKEQLRISDQMFMDFKYTSPGSKEQVRALNTLSFLVGMWADFLSREEKRMNAALSLSSSHWINRTHSFQRVCSHINFKSLQDNAVDRVSTYAKRPSWMGQDSRATIHCFVGFDDECYEVGCKIVFYVI